MVASFDLLLSQPTAVNSISMLIISLYFMGLDIMLDNGFVHN
jgi:hypothetical protein